MQGGSLDRDGWDRARSLFGEALERDPTERTAWLRAEVGDDSAVLREVHALLKRSEEAEPEREVAAEPAGETTRTDGKRPLPPGLPTSISSYNLLSVLGEGGMGWVFEARQQRPDRRVALKVVKAGLAGADTRRRFERESQLLGRLHHPAIAHVFEAGVTQVGTGIELPYFAMELVEDARTITRYAWEEQLDLEQRLQLFADVTDGIEHGHQRGVMHRDIKPGNIVVDGSGRREPGAAPAGVGRLGAAPPGFAPGAGAQRGPNHRQGTRRVGWSGVQARLAPSARRCPSRVPALVGPAQRRAPCRVEGYESLGPGRAAPAGWRAACREPLQGPAHERGPRRHPDDRRSRHRARRGSDRGRRGRRPGVE